METEVWVTCYSEKTDISISSGIYIDSADGSIDISDTGIIYEGLSESFWENYREFEEGVLRIEFYDEYSLKQAISVLKETDYTIYTK